MGELQVFENKDFGKMRTVEINDKLYFCALDAAKALGYSNTQDAIKRHCRSVVKHDANINGRLRSINFIPEGDVYRLIAHSKLPAAERFEMWIFEEVLPSIRRTGAYGQASPEEGLPELRSYIYLEQVCYTIRSFAEYSGLHRRTIADYIHRRRLLDKVDYVVLRGEELMSFRLSNPQLVEKSSSLIIIFESGAEKLFGQPVSEVVSVSAQVQVAHPRRGDELTELLRTQILLQQEILSLLTKPAM